MKAQEIMNRLEKAEANVEKRVRVIEKRKARAEKFLKKIEAKGWELDKELYRGKNDEAYLMVWDYEDILYEIKEAEKKLEDAQRIAQNWRDKLEAQVEVENKIATEIPEVFKEAKADLVKEWLAYDIGVRDKIRKDKSELPYKEFRKIWKYTVEESYNHTDEEFEKIEEKEAEKWLLNLWERVKDITGEVTDCTGIRWGGKCLDGIIKGKDGVAIVETIGAGGYNIQRYHLRVLVKAYKK